MDGAEQQTEEGAANVNTSQTDESAIDNQEEE
jgi:hypothetical protein